MKSMQATRCWRAMSTAARLPEWFGSVPPSTSRRLPLLTNDPPLYVPETLSPFSEVSPKIHEGWKEDFTQKANIWTLRVDAKSTGQWRKVLEKQNALLSLAATQSVVSSPGDESKRLLRTNFLASTLPDTLSTSEDCKVPSIDGVELSEDVQFLPAELELGYKYWTAEQCLRTLLPEEILDESPASFTAIGDILHLNLREAYLPYRYLVGQLILDRAPFARIVVNKIGEIEHQFRFFDMEILARRGEPRKTSSEFFVTLNYGGTKLSFDFSKVYFNTRLHTEHTRILAIYLTPESFSVKDIKNLHVPSIPDSLKLGSGKGIVADVMAGVGPFAIPAAKRGKYVFANDLNIHSYNACVANAQTNKVEDRTRCFNLDGHDFIRQSVIEAWHRPFSTPQPLAPKRSQSAIAPSPPPSPPPKYISNYILNLPSIALTFLSAFRGVLTPTLEDIEWNKLYEQHGMPLVHVYCFTREEGEEVKKDVVGRACEAMCCAVEDIGENEIFWVRKVAPKKDMYCLTFRLPKKVAYERL